MKNLLILLLLIYSFSCCQSKKGIRLELKNPANLERNDELVVIPRDSIVNKLQAFTNDMTLLVSDNGKGIPSQLDDLNADGVWDELALMCDFKPFQKIMLSIKMIKKSEAPSFTRRTNIRFAKIIQMGKKYEGRDTATRLKGYMTDSTKQYPQFEGPGWENDKVAFRNYFDERNGIDIFGKTTVKMVLDSVGIKEEYHTLKPWGMDILKVGNSLGAGSLGAYYKDSLYRVSAVEGATFRLVAEGPVRSILDLDFSKVNAGNCTYGLKHRISIVAGEYGYRSEVHVNNPSDNFMLVTGLVNLHCNELFTVQEGSATIFYTHDKQSENNDILGLGLILKTNCFQGSFRTANKGNGVINTFAMKMKMNSGEPISFRFLTGWELSDRLFANKSYFEKYLKEEAVKFTNPVVYSIK